MNKLYVRHNSRTSKLKSKRGKGWCLCDMAYIGHGEKCPNCNRVNGHKRDKKPRPEIDL